MATEEEFSRDAGAEINYIRLVSADNIKGEKEAREQNGKELQRRESASASI